jgi:hypothetical protein
MRRLGAFKNRVKEVMLSRRRRWMLTVAEREAHSTLLDLSEQSPKGIALASDTTSLERLVFSPDEEALVADVGNSLTIYPLNTEVPASAPLRLGPLLDMTEIVPNNGYMFSSPERGQVPFIAVSANGHWIILDKPHGAWWKVGSRSVTLLHFRLEDLLADAESMLPKPVACPTPLTTGRD